MPVQHLPTYRVHYRDGATSIFEDVVGHGDAVATANAISALIYKFRSRWEARSGDSTVSHDSGPAMHGGTQVLSATSARQLQEVIGGQGVTVVAYEATWCRKCRSVMRASRPALCVGAAIFVSMEIAVLDIAGKQLHRPREAFMKANPELLWQLFMAKSVISCLRS